MGTIGTQAEYARIPLADGTLVATPGQPDADLVPSLLAASDVLGTGWFAAVAAEAGPGKTVAVVGDGAVGLLGVLAAKQLGAERIIAFSRHADRQKLAREFGATDIVEERGDEGVAKIKELTNGLGAHSVIEAVGTQESMMQAIRATRPGGHVGYVGVSHDVALPGDELFFSGVHLHGGPAPVRRFLPELIQLIWDRKIDPGKVFDLDPADSRQAAEGYQAMDERRAIKVLLQLSTQLNTKEITVKYTQSGGQTGAGPTDWFTGTVYIDGVRNPDDQSAIGLRARPVHPRRPHRLAPPPQGPDALRHRRHRPRRHAAAAASRRSVPATSSTSSRARSTGTAPPQTGSWRTSPCRKPTTTARSSPGSSTSPTRTTAPERR